MQQEFILTAIRSTQPLARVAGDLWQVTAETNNKPRVLTDNELYGHCYSLISHGENAVPIQHNGMNFLLMERGHDPASIVENAPELRFAFELKKKGIHASSVKEESGLRRAIAMKVRSILENKGVRRIGPSKFSLQDTLSCGNLNSEWYKPEELEGDVGILNFRRYSTFAVEALDTSHALLVCKTRSMLSLRDESGRPFTLDTLFEKHRNIKDYVESAQNQEDRVLVRYGLNMATYSPVAIEYATPSSLWEPRYNMSLYQRLSKEFAADEVRLKEIEVAKNDPFVVRAYRLGRPRVGEPEPIIPRFATPIVTLSNHEFLQEKLEKKVSWREATDFHPKLHYYGTLGIQNVINSANCRIFDTSLNFDVPICVEAMNPASRFDVRPLMLFSIPKPTLLLRDWAQQIVKLRLSGKIRTDVMRSGDNFPYIPVLSQKLSYAIICPESEKEKARFLKGVLEGSPLVSFLFGRDGKELAVSKNLLHYEWIAEASPTSYITKIREIKSNYTGIFALIPSRDIEISTEIFRAIKLESIYNDIALQPVQLRRDYSYFDGNLWYAMFRKNKGSAIGIDLSELNVPKNTILISRDASSRRNGTEGASAAFVSSISADMATGYILSDRATLRGETVQNVYDILDKTKRSVWKDRMKCVPEAVIRLREGYPSWQEESEEMRFFEENEIPFVAIDLLNDSGGKFLKKVMDDVEPYNVPLAAVILDSKTAILQPHMVRSTFPPSPLKVRLATKTRGIEKFSIYDALAVVADSVFITHSTISVEYVKTPDIVSKARKAAELHRISALPPSSTFWIGHLD